MLEVTYSPAFIRFFKKLPQVIIDESLDKIELLRNPKNHQQLKVHKLRGSLRGRFSFSVNYSYRVVFVYLDSKTIYLLAIGDHDEVY